MFLLHFKGGSVMEVLPNFDLNFSFSDCTDCWQRRPVY